MCCWSRIRRCSPRAWPGSSPVDPTSRRSRSQRLSRSCSAPALHPQVDVAVVDWHLGDASGAASIDEIRRIAPDAKVVVLTGSDHARVLDAALAAGCDGFVSKSAPVGALDAAIDSALSGGCSITARSMRPPMGAAASDPGLSGRELEVVASLVEGMSNAEIGEALFISANTVRNHGQRISAKLGASSRLDIAMSALRRGLVELPR